jgi:hypothetical protein
MERAGHENVTIFTGIEVEHTAQYKQPTVFVIGVQNINEIERRAESFGARHIYLGANHSFPRNPNAESWANFEGMAKYFLKKDYWVTLDLDIAEVEGLLESGLPEYRRFIPMISAKLPYINQLGYNAVLKIDDTDFDHSNFGVWCHRLHDLQSASTFTGWDAYKDDEVWQ